MITEFIFAVMIENSDEVVYCVFEDKEEAEKFLSTNFGKGEAWVEEVPFVKKIVKEDKMEAIGLLTQIKLSYKEQIKRLREENEKLRDGEILLKTRIRNLEEENKERKGEIDQLKSLVNSKSDYILELKSDNRKLKADNEKLRKKI